MQIIYKGKKKKVGELNTSGRGRKLIATQSNHGIYYPEGQCKDSVLLINGCGMSIRSGNI